MHMEFAMIGILGAGAGFADSVLDLRQGHGPAVIRTDPT